jgi:hypothetical protein
VAELVETDRVLAGLDAAVTEPRVAEAVSRFGAPSRERLLARLRASEVKLGAWLPDSARDRLAELLGRPAPVPRALIDQVVASARVREAVRQMLQETLARFVEKTLASMPGKGLRDVLGLGARAAGGLFGALGEEVQRLLQKSARDFVDTGVRMVQKRLAETLASEETARTLGERRRQAFLELLERKESEVAAYVDRVPHAELEALAPAIAVHNLQRAELRAALRAEVEAALTELSQRTVGELLDAYGLREKSREALHAHGAPLLRAFLASPHYQRWLAPS